MADAGEATKQTMHETAARRTSWERAVRRIGSARARVRTWKSSVRAYVVAEMGEAASSVAPHLSFPRAHAPHVAVRGCDARRRGMPRFVRITCTCS